MGVFVNALLHQIGNHGQFLFQGGRLGFQSACVECRKDCTDNRFNDRSLIGYKLIDRRNEQGLQFFIGKVRRGAFFFTIEFVVAAPDGLAVFVGRVPSLGAVPVSALTAFDFAREKVDTAVPTPAAVSPC